MTQKPAIDEVRQAVAESLRIGHMEPMMKYFSDDMLMHAEGSSPLAGDHRGRDEVLSLLPRLVERSGGTMSIEVVDAAVGDSFVTRVEATRGEAHMTHEVCAVWRMHDGEVIEFWDHFGDVEEWDAFWR
jgi:uncharacterized protein